MAVNRKGTSITEEPVVVRRTADGTVTTRKFRGDSTLVAAKEEELFNLGYETELTQGPNWALTATFTTTSSDPVDPTNPNVDTIPEPTWEMIPNTFEQSIYECGRPLITAVPTIMREMVEFKVRNPNNKDTLFYFPPTLTIDAATLAAADRIYCMRRMGIEGRESYTWTLRRSVVIQSSNENLDWTNARAEKILSTLKVKSLFNVPFNMAKLMPPSYVANENQSVVPDSDPVVIPFYYGWKQSPINPQTVGTNRIQYSQSWTYNKWSVTLSPSLPGLYDLEV